ncbi:glycosyltransferase [Flavobacterium sp. LMO8]|uniref:glycogen synthase n=1 Tax=Flavobacterium sp. LMO8 TaxID=2654244 RepID=UPI0012921D3C|nr:glycogen/starch synthase [Flavobacterium sp. LMO8]MQP24030.1 glycosyltransferase [Flavobacterium sp. LMO8]
MKITHISAECYPIAKVGGLADVVGALPKYQNTSSNSSQVIIPFYNLKFTQNNEFKILFESELQLGVNNYKYRVLQLQENSLDFEVFFIDVPELLFNEYVYSSDDTDRFLAFQIATLDWILTWNKKPNIIHCHDHHTGLIPFMLQESFNYETLNTIPVILTIHNAQYQGWFSHEKVNYLPEFNLDHFGLLDWNYQINPLAAGIKCAWAVTTVSPSYMEELKQSANGLESLLSHETSKCKGILNGIDAEVWNPENDAFIVKKYKSRTIKSGRDANKNYLCKTFNLDASKPLFAFIGRLVHEKGSDLLPEVFKEVLKNRDISVLVLGSGNKENEVELNALVSDYSGNYNAFIGYDEKLSHIIYAGADFLLMPSRVEPCGLNQMYALRYGAIPIVRNIGGLKDTIIDIDNDGFGILHEEVEVNQIVDAIIRAKKLYSKKTKFSDIRKQIVEIDHSWFVSAKEYTKLYKSL